MVRDLAWLLIFAGSLSARAAEPLDTPCKLDCRSTPLAQALDELTARLGLPYMLDASVTDEAAQTPVRLFADHLSGRQALRWLARWADLEAVLVDGTLLIARPDRIPDVWRCNTALHSREVEPRWQAARKRLIDIDWVDAPLSFVSRDISARFGIDLIFHPEILRKQDLMHLKRSQLRLDDLCEALKRPFDAEIDYLDGALWARPRTAPVASRPDQTELPSLTAQPRPGLRLARLVDINQSVADWQALGEVLALATGLKCRVVAPPDAAGPRWEAWGSAAEILEAGKLLGQLDYRLDSASDQKPSVLLIQVHLVGRYPP